MMPSLTNRVPTNSETCKYRELKKNYGQMKIISQKMFFGTEQSCSSTIQCSSKRTPSRSRTTDDSIAKCFFSDSSDGTLHKVLTFQLEKRVKKCANILEDNALLGKPSAGDMIALDALYYSTCLLNLYRECNQKKTEVAYNDTVKQIHGQVLRQLAQYME